VLAYPNRHYPPAAEALALADSLLESLDELTRNPRNADAGSGPLK
jgi:hypothetical protein